MSADHILTFVPFGELQYGFLGVHIVGAVRARIGGDCANEWTSFIGGHYAYPNWKPARDGEAAKDALNRYIADWYDAAHQPLAEGQGERLASQARVG